jgi:hypothetical protein
MTTRIIEVRRIMGRRTFTTTQIVEMLRGWHNGHTVTEIAATVGVDRKTVRKYVQCATDAGIRPGIGEVTSTEWRELVHRHYPEIENPLLRTTWHDLDNHGALIREMRRSGHSYESIWRRLRAESRSSVSVASLKRWSRLNLTNQTAA